MDHPTMFPFYLSLSFRFLIRTICMIRGCHLLVDDPLSDAGTCSNLFPQFFHKPVNR